MDKGNGGGFLVSIPSRKKNSLLVADKHIKVYPTEKMQTPDEAPQLQNGSSNCTEIHLDILTLDLFNVGVCFLFNLQVNFCNKVNKIEEI